MDDREALRRLAARRWRVAVVLTTVMIVAYFGFILMIAFAKPTAGTLLAGGDLSVGIVIGACVIALAPVLTGIYVWWTNRHYDAALAELRGRRDERAP